MQRRSPWSPILLAVLAAAMPAQDEVVTFKSDVSLVRVDVQVLDRSGQRAVTGLTARDFVLRDEGQIREIRNFAAEDMPVDVLFLLDVSGSMRPHVESIAQAAHRAFDALGDDDRVAIMVFDRRSRLRLPFTKNLDKVIGGFDELLRQEDFDGGTDIPRGLLDAAQYVRTSARRDARRAIVIVTDDMTQRGRADGDTFGALTRADAVLMAIISPNAVQNQAPIQFPFPSRRRGPVIFGPPMGGPTMSNTRAAGTPELARQTGGDSMPISRSGALETTLNRIRQRYALYFLVPPGARAGEQRSIDIQLAGAADRRYPGAEVRFRRTYVASSDVAGAPPEVSQSTPTNESSPSVSTTADGSAPRLKRRPSPVVLDNPTGPRTTSGPGESAGGWKREGNATPAPSAAGSPSPAPTTEQPQQGGWRKVKPGEQQQ